MFTGKEKKLFNKIVKQLNKNVAKSTIKRNSKNTNNVKNKQKI